MDQTPGISTAEPAAAIVNTLRGRPHLAAVRAAGVDATAQFPANVGEHMSTRYRSGWNPHFGAHRGAEIPAETDNPGQQTPANEADMSDSTAPAKPRNETRTETKTPRARSINNDQDFQKSWSDGGGGGI